MRWILIALMLATGLASVAARAESPPTQSRFADATTKIVGALNGGNVPSVYALFDKAMLDAVSEAQMKGIFQGFAQTYGHVQKTGEPNVSGATAVVRLTMERGALNMRLTLDPDGRIAGLYFNEAVDEVSVPARNTVALRLPFDGEWTVFWGGATEEQNYHIKVRNQRRALDIVIRDEHGKSYNAQANRNEDYYCYGKPILAPADATVVTAIDGVPDNRPGSMNPYSALGNCLVLRLAEHEFAVIAHLQPHSIRVKEGEKVSAGAPLGLCGNSGNSSEPHLHFHLQNTAAIQDGTGFDAFFKNVTLTRDGKTTEETETTLVRGDRVRVK